MFKYLIGLLLWKKKIKHRLCDEILFIRDIKPLNGDSNFISYSVLFYKSGILVLVLFSFSFFLDQT